MNARLERILLKLARQHAPHLAPPGWEQSGDPLQRIPILARQLARYNQLVIMGYLPTGLLDLRENHIQSWVNEYGHLYALFARNLFPSLAAIHAQYADDKFPPIIVIRGDATPVINVLAGFITPYVAARQAQPNLSEIKLVGLMSVVLEELEAGDLPRARYDSLRAECITVVKRLLDVPVRQIGLTGFDKPVLGKTQTLSAPPDQLPEQDAPPKAPAAPPAISDEPPRQTAPKYELPMLEDDPDDPPTPTEQMFKTAIPLDTGRFKRRLPIPDLPDDDPPSE